MTEYGLTASFFFVLEKIVVTRWLSRVYDGARPAAPA